jgi:hypothetical protein
MAMEPDDFLIQRAALALAHLMSASGDDEMKDLDRDTIRRCAGAPNFRRLVIDYAQTWTTVIENGIERAADRSEIEAALRTIIDN